MKRILITGANSYIGGSFENWLAGQPQDYRVDTVDMLNGSWRERSFSGYDAVFHVAGIAHVSADPSREELYYKVNCDLAVETAQKAKADGVRQFIFMSSIIVYGDSGKIGERRVITPDTVPEPENFYGESKLRAEKGLNALREEKFRVVIVRPPMIYGKNSKGNYPKLAQYAKKFPLFPNVENERSMLHIDNLCQFLKLAVDREEDGLFFPQNTEYVKTSELVRLIAGVHGKKIRLIRFFNPLLRLLSKKVGVINKVFGNLVYEKEMSRYPENYAVRDLEDSVELTERSE